MIMKMEVINEFEKMLNDTAKTIVYNKMEGVDMSEVDIIPVNSFWFNCWSGKF